MYYRDFEKLTLARGLLLPSYPASKNICALGGMVANNSGGEKTLFYGKTADYVAALKVVLADGKEYEINPGVPTAGEIYEKIYKLITDNMQIITKAKPKVAKNSAGYALWDVWESDSQTFDLTRLFVGSQGTLGLTTEITFKLVPVKKHSRLVVIFLMLLLLSVLVLVLLLIGLI